MYQEEPLKDFLNRFRALVVKLHTKDEVMMVHALRKGILSGPFSDSLIRCQPKMFSEIRRRVVAHIGAEKEVTVKRGSVGPARLWESSRAQPLRVHEDAMEKRSSPRHAPYEHKKHQIRARAKGDVPCRHKFRIALKELIVIPDVANKLKPPPQTEKRLGPSRDTWCEFHKSFGHSLHNCLTLGHQLAGLVNEGFLKEYLEEGHETSTMVTPTGVHGHEVPVHGEFNTISEGF